jgi:methylmalonyl-CoA mutase N-terminal domain/subunit
MAAKGLSHWLQDVYGKAVARFGERKDRFISGSGEEIDPLYSADPPEAPVGLPGEYPYTRGVQPTMYRGRLWTMRQYAGFGDADESNKRYKYLLSQGQQGLSIAMDLPTQIGFDSDDPIAAGEVGKVGVAVDSLADFERLFDGIPLDEISTSVTANATASILLAFYIALAEKRGISPDKLKGTVQNDILKEYIARGTYIFPPEPSMRLTTDLFAYCSREVPGWNTISISGYHIREAGSTAAQEVGLTLADGIAYVQAALDAGLEVDSFAPRLSFFFNAHNDLLEEVAKYRAARRLWAGIMKERFGARKDKSMMLRFHTQTAGSTLTAQQPDNNIVRVTIQSLAAVLGGTQSLHTNSRDEALALPTEESVRIALRTQQIVAEESGVTNTIDPLAGSYYIEELTDRIEKQAREYIEAVDNMGGMVKAIEEGWPQREIQNSAYEYQKDIESGERIIVGVNKYVIEEPSPSGLHRVNPEVEQNQIRRLSEVKAGRNQEEVRAILDEIRTCAMGSDNLMPLFVRAAHAYVTLGEIVKVLKDVFGEYRENVVL